MIAVLTSILYAISNALLVPDVVLLLGGAAASIFLAGGVLGESRRRRRMLASHHGFRAGLLAEPGKPVPAAEIEAGSPLVPHYLPGFGPRCDRDRLLDDLRLRMDRSLDRLNLLVRLGPLLGLAGTLIPLGPGLIALSNGDVGALSRNLVVAFTSTVLGLFISGTCYFLLMVRRQWYAQDLADLEYLLGRMEG